MPRLLFILCLIALGLAAPAAGQQSAPATSAAPASAISPAQARQALDVLNDPQKRAQFTATLEAIVKAQPAPEAAKKSAPGGTTPSPASAATPAPVSAAKTPSPFAPNGLGAEVVVRASDFLNHVSNEALAALRAVRSVPLLWAWLYVMATNPMGQGILLDTAWRLALVLAIGIAVEWALGHAVRRPILALARRAPNGGPMPNEDGEARAELGETEPPHRRRRTALLLLRRIPLVIGRLVLELLPVLGFVLIGHTMALTPLGGDELPRLVLLAVIDAYALCAAILCIGRMLFSPDEPRLRLLRISDDQAAYATHWTRRIVVVAVFGYAIAEVGLLLGLSDAAHDALLKATGLIDHVLLAIVVLQCRRTVRHWLRAPPGSVGFFAAARNWLARVWHWIAIFVTRRALAGVGSGNPARLFSGTALSCQHHRRAGCSASGADRPTRRARSHAAGETGHCVALPGDRDAAGDLLPCGGQCDTRADLSRQRHHPAAALGTWRARLAGRRHRSASACCPRSSRWR